MFGSLRLLRTSLLAAVFLCAGPATAPRPALAGLGDCVDALSETASLAQYITEQGVKIAGCGDKLAASPPLSGAVTALLAGIMALGGFNDEDTCKGLVGSTVASMFAALLEESDTLQSAMVKVLGSKELVQEFIDKAGSEVGAQLVSLPALEPIFGVMTCGCTVLGTVIGTLEHTKKVIEETKACASAVGGFIADIGETIHCWNSCGAATTTSCDIIDVHLKPGDDFNVKMMEAKLASGAWWDFCGYRGFCPSHNGGPEVNVGFGVMSLDAPNAATVGVDGAVRCDCGPGMGFDEAAAKDGIEGNAKCVSCTGPGKVLKTGTQTYLTNGIMNYTNGSICHEWSCNPKPGMKFVSYGSEPDSCNFAHACNEPNVWDSKTGTCSPCKTNTVFNGYHNSDGSENTGTCQACPQDSYSSGGVMMNCVKLQCEGLSYAKNHQCVPCKNVFNPQQIALKGAFGKPFGGKAFCLDQLEEPVDEQGTAQPPPPPCGRGTIRFPDGACRVAPPELRASLPPAKRIVPGSGPIERKVNPAPQVSSPGRDATPRIQAPSLEDFGTPSFGGSAPQLRGGQGVQQAPAPSPGAVAPAYRR